MHPRFLTIFALSAALVSARAEEKDKEPAAQAFPGLKTLAIPEKDTPFPGQVAYDAALAEVIDLPLPLEEGAPEVRRMIATRLNRDAEARYLIDFDPGPSADPSFIITDEKSGQQLGTIAADSLALPGNGFIYSRSRSNHLHTEQRKYTVRDGKLVEIEQPFSYVGLESKAKVPLTLLAKKDGGDVIAKIPEGDALQVVIRDGEHLLIKTRFGLVGWWKMKTDVMADNAEIEGIYYAGD